MSVLKQIKIGTGTATPIAQTVVTTGAENAAALTVTGSNTGLADNADPSYAIKLAVDGATITGAASGLATALALKYFGAEGSGESAKEARIALVDKNGGSGSTELSAVNVSTLISGGIVKSAQYNPSTGILTITFVGGDPINVNLSELLDFDDIIIKSNSTDYLQFEKTVTYVTSEAGYKSPITTTEYAALGESDKAKYTLNDDETAQLSVKLADVTYTATSGNTPADLTASTTNGKMLDASDAIPAIKGYVDDVVAHSSASLAVEAQGDKYVGASIDPNNNKKVIITTDVQNVTATAGTPGTYNSTTGAQTTAPVAGTLSGVADSLVDGADVASKVKTYVDGAIAIEATRSDADTKAKIYALTATKGSTTPATGKNVAVQVVEEHGVITGVTVTDSTPTAISNAINALDVTDTAVSGQYVTAVSETDGKVSITRKAIIGSEVTLTGYETTKTGTNDIAATDTVNAAFKKIENKIDENERVTAGALNDLRAADTAIDAAVGLGAGHTYTNSGTYIGGTGATVKTDIQALDTAVASIASGIEGLDAEVTSIDGTNVQVKVTEVDGKITAVNVTTDKTVNATDVSNAIKALDATVGSATVASGKHVAVQVVEADGKLTGVTVTESDIASAQGLANEITRAQNAEGEIAGLVGLTGNEGSRAFTPTDNYGTGTTSVAGNMQAIDTQVKTNADAIAGINTTINNLDLDDSAVSGEYVSEVDQTNGQISVTRAEIGTAVIKGFTTNTSATGAIAATDTISDAYNKLQNKIDGIQYNVNGTTLEILGIPAAS